MMGPDRYDCSSPKWPARLHGSGHKWPELCDAWTPERAPSDFAERTVQAMLAEGRPRSARIRRRRWLGMLSLAALLLGTSAWAMLHERSDREALVATPLLPAPALVETPPHTSPERRPAPTVITPAEAPPASKTGQPRARRDKVSDQLPLVVQQPRCTCDHDGVLCTCVD